MMGYTPPDGSGACRDTPLSLLRAGSRLGADGHMVSVSFQSTVMSGVFAFFPRALLVHRAGGRAGRALYVFLVAGLAPPQWGGMARVVHLAIPRDESAGSLARMYETFRAFNPAWAKTRLILVSPGLPEESVLAQAFPAAEVQLSIFHLCKRLKQQIQQMALEGPTEHRVLASLNDAMRAASETSRRKIHTLLRRMVTPDVQSQLCIDWLLDDEIWAAHRKRTWGVGGSYFKDLEIVTQGLNRVFRCQPETLQALFFQDEPRSPQSSSDPSSPAAKLQAIEILEGDSKEEIKRRAEECIKQSLSDICTEPAARLCLSEFAVVQKSVQLIGTEENALSIRVLEDAHRVDMKGLSSCTCHFNQVFQLPCRHILAVLNLDRRTLQPEMLSRQWQKGCDAHQAGQDSADGLLEILKSSWDESLDKSLVVSFLTAEIGRLLTHCSREEFERRYRTLRELADGWIGPYVEVKL
uniref:Zinc finger SWIM-type containing 1 n=1 Tax=Strix occidentalis caurina TaxID=311401 RepID=A0A8D0FUP4_STROC